MRLSFHVPGEVVAKARHRTATFHKRDGSIGTMNYADSRTSNYESRVCLFASNAMKDQKLDRFSEPVSVSCRFWLQIPKSAKKRAGRSWHTQTPDVSNILKAIEDGMNKVVYVDDCLVAVIYAEKRWTHGEPGADIVVESLGADEKFRLPLSWIIE